MLAVTEVETNTQTVSECVLFVWTFKYCFY